MDTIVKEKPTFVPSHRPTITLNSSVGPMRLEVINVHDSKGRIEVFLFSKEWGPIPLSVNAPKVRLGAREFLFDIKRFDGVITPLSDARIIEDTGRKARVGEMDPENWTGS
jgi:hypothetical protein